MNGKDVVAKGVGASPGIATGTIVFRAEDAVALGGEGRSVILVRVEATAEDVPGIRAAAGVVTTRGGITGDGAIVARSLGKPCVTSCPTMNLEQAAERITIWRDSVDGQEDIVLQKGDVLTIDGGRGEILR